MDAAWIIVHPGNRSLDPKQDTQEEGKFIAILRKGSHCEELLLSYLTQGRDAASDLMGKKKIQGNATESYDEIKRRQPTKKEGGFAREGRQN